MKCDRAFDFKQRYSACIRALHRLSVSCIFNQTTRNNLNVWVHAVIYGDISETVHNRRSLMED